jgi:NADPH:quinone reductase-like Zn-dependent oxidoreductase/SAM-dependent methyltransferase/NADP-dependent 3-hydroxy acid dehydrogenase YdfG/acyl carrier protein
LQVVAAAVVDGAPSDAVFMPLEIESCAIAAAGRPLTQCRAHARLLSAVDGSAEVLRAELNVYDGSGTPVATLCGIQFKRVNRATLARLREAKVDDWLVELTWEAAQDGRSGLSPLALAANVRGTIAANSIATGWEQWNEVEPQLDRVCRGYIARAFADLGHRWAVGDLLDASTLAGKLHVKPHYSRLLGRFLDILAADGVVRRDGSGWRVLRAPVLDGSDAELANLRARYPAFEAEIAFTGRCGPELAAALAGRSDPLHLLFPGGDASTAEHLYRDSPSARLYNGIVRDAVAGAVATFPAGRRLRVLEIGGGTASTTSHVLPVLPAHGTYLFTDVSPLFVAKAAERFASRSTFGARTLDIERDPREQGIDGDFDIVIAANVLHATRDLSQTFANVRRLLTPGGLLICVEITRPQDWIDLSFGLTEGWWRFSDAQWRPEYPLLTTAQWTRFLASNGFDEVAALPEGADASRALTLNAVILARASRLQSRETPRRLLVLADSGGLARPSVEWLRKAGHSISVAYESDRYARRDDGFLVEPSSREHFDRVLQESAHALGGALDGVLHFWSLDHSALGASSVAALQQAMSRVTNGALHLAQALIGGAQSPLPSLWIVTRGGVALAGQPVEPLAGSLWGWARSLRLEHPELRCMSLDLDPGDPAGAPRAIAESLSRKDEEAELAWRGGLAHVSRLRPARPAGGSSTQDELPRHLEIAQRGDLDNLVLGPLRRRAPGAGEVEIRVRATGLNFRDVLSALGMYPGDPGPLGSELAGEVLAVGEGVESVRAGDEVIALAADAFATHAIAGAALVVAKPRELTFAQAAALPNAFLTAHWALNTLGKMKAGERVLVHAAAGGVGLAAVQLAQRAGAEIFATAGSDEKRAYLRSLGIRHVFDSRSLGFSEQVLAATKGRGVDLVLNSLAGDFIGASLATLAPNGRFLEIGRTEVWSAEQVRARFPGVEYHLIDLGKDYAATPERIRPLLLELVKSVQCGELHPLPMRTFALAEANAAFRHMAQARHIGKIVLTQPWSCTAPGIPVRADGAYWITGGLSGLGLAVAEWLVDRGARHLALMGRRAPDDAALTTLARLRASGAQVMTIEGDVSVEADVTRTREAIRTAAMPPLAGVLHAAGALDDGAIESQTPERYERVFAAKMRGAWLLRSATRDATLDFFVLFSSAAGLFGSAGQTNHGAANAYLDAFAHALRAEGVPAISIDWGAWSRIGAAAGDSMGQRLREKGLERLSPEDGLAAFGAVLRRAPAQIGVIAADWPRFVAQLPVGAARFMGALVTSAGARVQVSRTQNDAPVAADSLVARLAAAPADRRRALLQADIRTHACKVLSLPSTHAVDIRSPLAGLGLDSLMAVELRNRLGTATGRTLPATLLFDYPTIEALCDYLAQVLEIAPATPPIAPAAATDDMLGHVASLSEDELDRLLAAKMMAD